MGMFGGDNELGNILQDAVKLKSAQMGQKRKTYETWPFFVQHTLFHGDKEDFKAWRQLPFKEKMEQSERIKSEGNDLYGKNVWGDAVDKYEEACSLVYYCYSTDPGWRKNNRGIDDDVIILVDDHGETEEEEAAQKKIRLTCALNIAACKLQLQKYDEVIVACDYVLELDPNNVKALYRRAEARVRPAKATAYDNDCAVKDLSKAQKIEPKHPTVAKLLAELKGEQKVQRDKDKGTFEGMFGRGEIYDENGGDTAGTNPPPAKEGDHDLSDIQERIKNISDDDSLEKRAADAELLRDLYMRNGKEEEARELNDKIKVAKKALKERENPAPQREVDWDNPTDEMLEDALKQGLDLKDPIVIAELKRLEREGVDAQPGEAGENLPAPGELPCPVAVEKADVPWLKYVALYCVIFLIFRLGESGVLRAITKFFWRRTIGIVIRAILGTAEDVDAEESGSLFATAYRQIVAFLEGVEGDAGEL